MFLVHADPQFPSYLEQHLNACAGENKRCREWNCSSMISDLNTISITNQIISIYFYYEL